ncbi:MAG: bile acid:sodium symporter family protein [Desulfitobacteriaceae bacterium]
MLQYFFRGNEWLGKRMFFVVLSALLLGFILSIPKNPASASISIGLFAYMTFVTALGISFKDFIRVLRNPRIVIWMLLLVHIAMPIVAWGIGSLFYQDSYLTRLGLLMGASIPIGVTSVIWTSVVSGDVALALVAVMMDTIVSPVLLPAFILLVAGKAVHIDYVHMLVELLWMVTIPSTLGMIVNDLTHQRLANFTRSVGGLTSKFALFLVVFLNASAVAPEISWNLSLIKMLLVILLLVICGYVLGYAGSFVLSNRKRAIVVTMVYNVGMRNIAFGAVLAIAYSPASVAIPITLAMLFQQPLAAVVSYLFNRFDRNHPLT